MGSQDLLRWEKALDRGEKLVSKMKAEEITSQSKFDSEHHLLDSGWERVEKFIEPPIYQRMIASEIASKTWKEIDLPNGEGIMWEYTGIPKGTNRLEAYFENSYNTDKGIIYVLSAKSPKHQQSITLEADPDKNYHLPDLIHWSDVTYIQWAIQTKQPKNLNCIWHMQVVNEDTRKIVMEAFEKTHKGQAGLPRERTFSMEEEAGKAIIGTPNGYGVAYLLIEHRDNKQLGLKEVVSVRAIFGKYGGTMVGSANSYGPLYLQFKIRDANGK